MFFIRSLRVCLCDASLCSATQLLRTGLVHADPHEGNMMYTDDGRLALLDFGLVCRVDNEKQEAMASCILDILNANWEGASQAAPALRVCLDTAHL